MLTISVTGPTDSLGTDILLHEHLIFNHSSRALPPVKSEDTAMRDEEITLGRLAVLRQNARVALTNWRGPPADVLVRELIALRAGRPAGSCTIVDASVAGRDVAGLRALSEASGVTIIASAGVTADEASACADDIDALADRLVNELTHGVVGVDPPVRCGVLVLGDCMAPDSPPAARGATLGAIGQAHRRTGAPVLLALPAVLGDAASAIGAVSELMDAGVRASGLVICHAQRLLAADMAPAIERLVSLGVSLCVDSIGCDWMVAGAGSAASLPPFEAPPADAALAPQIMALLRRDGQLAQRLLLSHAVASRLQFETYGGGGLRHLRLAFLPRLVHLGLGADDSDRITRGNAALLLAWWRPAAPPPRVCKQWECDGCHRRFDEAVNVSEALPTDQDYYEKLTFRYCSTHCLSQHRKAGFPASFTCAPPT